MPRDLTLDSTRFSLHLAQPAVHLLQPFRDEPEALAEPRFERGLQPLVDGGAYLFQLLCVVRLQRRELRLHGRAHVGQCRLQRARERLQVLLHRLAVRGQLLRLHARGLCDLRGERRLHFREPCAGLDAHLARRRLHRGAQLALQPFVGPRVRRCHP
jgi:hypothetical protein